MYSDLLESSSKDNYSFNDQSSSYDMAEVNEISNQTNLDYIFDSYYSSVSHYNTGFDLPEDCKNMSFSELFDQELFSTHENKDCKLTIKIEKEESSNQCYSAGNSQDTIVSHSPVKVVENISSTSSKSFAPKRGINRTSIKATKNCDVERLIHSSFYESEKQDSQLMANIRKPIIKLEPVDLNDTIEQKIVGLEVKPGSTDDSQNTIDSHSLMKIEDNVQSSLSINTAHKHSAINTISIKNTKINNVKHPMSNVVGESNNLVFDEIETYFIKLEPEEVNDIIEQEINKEINPYSAKDLQTTIDSHSLLNRKDIIQSSLLKSFTSENSVIHKTSIEPSKNCDIKNSMLNNLSETKNLDLDQISKRIKTPIIKCEPEKVNGIIEQKKSMKINPYSTEDLQNKIDSHNLVKRKNNNQLSILKSSASKRSVINKTSLKFSKNCDIKKSVFNNTSETKSLGLNKMSTKIKTPIIKCEPKEINDIIEQEITMEINPCSIEDLQNKIDSHSLIKRKDNIQSSLLKSSTVKHPIINKTPLKSSKNCDTKNSSSNNLFETENLSYNQISMKIKTPINKCEPEDINDIIEQDIEMEMNQCLSFDGCQNEIVNCRDVNNIKNNFSSLLSKDFTLNRQDINRVSLKKTENLSGNHIIGCELDGPVNDQMTAKVKIPVVKCEPKDLNDSVNQNNVGMEIHLKEETLINKESSNYTGLEDFCCNNLNCTKIENQNIAIIKKENILSNITSVKNDDIETVKNDITIDSEKKKISWEEYKAKIGKMGLSIISEDNDDPVTDIDAINNDKLETVKEEFDRNTAEYFIGQKRKIEDKEQQRINAKEMNSEEDQELQNKRMKIEYIKKLLPSSFASEIAKTSILMKGNNYIDDNENENTSDDSIIPLDKTQGKNADIHLKKDDKSQKKFHDSRAHSSYRSSSRSEYCNKSSRLSSSSSSSNSDDYYNRSRIDVPQNGQYNQNLRNTVQRSRDQKRVVYVGQIPIKFGKRYLYNRFKMFGTIQSLTLHKKPDFRVYYAFVTYSEKSEAEYAINHGNDDITQVQLDIRFGERKQTQTPYYDLDDEWLTDWYGYNQPVPVVKAPSPEKTSFEEELQAFYQLAQTKKSNQIKSSQVS